MKRIIQYMKQQLDIYRFVKLVEDTTVTRNEDDPPEHSLSGFQSWHPTTLYVKQEYIKRYKRIGLPQTNTICVDSIRGGYLEGNTENRDGLTIDTLCLTSKGRALIDTVPLLPFLHVGLYEAWLSNFPSLLKFLFGGATAIIIGLIYLVFKYLKDLL